MTDAIAGTAYRRGLGIGGVGPATLDGAMTVISEGTPAPPIPGVDLAGSGPQALFFYKVTCPVCQMVAPLVERLASAYPGTVTGIGQDPAPKLGKFAGEFGWSFDSTPDLPPYAVSDAYGIEVVPTVVLVDRGTVVDVVESWDRDRYDEAVSRLAELTGRPAVRLSGEGDGLPPFRPG
jgi:thiol-disulfide isomerase/thioredoxin